VNNYVVNQLLAESTDAKFVERKSQEFVLFFECTHTYSKFVERKSQGLFILFIFTHTYSKFVERESQDFFIFFIFAHTYSKLFVEGKGRSSEFSFVFTCIRAYGNLVQRKSEKGTNHL